MFMHAQGTKIYWWKIEIGTSDQWLDVICKCITMWQYFIMPILCEETHEMRQDLIRKCSQGDLFSKPEVVPTLGILDLGFLDVCLRYFWLAFIKEVYHSAMTFSPKMVFGEMFVPYYPSSASGFSVWSYFNSRRCSIKLSFICLQDVFLLWYDVSLQGLSMFREGAS